MMPLACSMGAWRVREATSCSTRVTSSATRSRSSSGVAARSAVAPKSRRKFLGVLLGQWRWNMSCTSPGRCRRRRAEHAPASCGTAEASVNPGLVPAISHTGRADAAAGRVFGRGHPDHRHHGVRQLRHHYQESIFNHDLRPFRLSTALCAVRTDTRHLRDSTVPLQPSARQGLDHYCKVSCVNEPVEVRGP